MRYLRIALIVLSVLFIGIPVTIVGITGNGWREITSKIFISLSIVSLIGAILINLNKNRLFAKIGICIGLLIILISQWF